MPHCPSSPTSGSKRCLKTNSPGEGVQHVEVSAGAAHERTAGVGQALVPSLPLAAMHVSETKPSAAHNKLRDMGEWLQKAT